MCGIAGIVSSRPLPSGTSRTLREMSAAIAHRGPDGEGFLSYDGKEATVSSTPQEDAGALVAFAHRRLSILDLTETGQQPMKDESGRAWITYNGEIYNYRELRDTLRGMGYTFRSTGDTEVVLNAYLAWGRSCVERFNGMWSFCLLDTEQKTCFASRDRFGVKPFYYVRTAEGFSFASEQKAFVRAGLVKPVANAAAVRKYLVNGYLETSPENFFEGITELMPGSSLVFDLKSGELRNEKHFRLSDILTQVNNGLTDKSIIERTRVLTTRAIELRMRSDVEVGTCLSGGLDSSVIAATMAAHSGKPVHCFTSGFEGEPFDETAFAERVAEKIHAKHHVTTPDLAGFIRDCDELIYSQDVPIWDTSTYAQHRVMALAKENGIKVVLDGQGADELFGGYHHHFLPVWNFQLSRLRLAPLWRSLSAASGTVPGAPGFYVRQAVRRFVPAGPQVASRILRSDYVKLERSGRGKLYLDLNQRLVRDIEHDRLKIFLKCEDRCGMWHSVESRTPFSDDIDLIRFMFSFNGNRKMRNGISKYFLREAMRPLLPAAITDRREKLGFETPMRKWTAAMHPTMLEEVRAARFDFVDDRKLSRSRADDASTNKLLFKLFVLARWQRIFGERYQAGRNS